MKARLAVMVVLAAALTEGCRRAETPAPTPSPTATVATPLVPNDVSIRPSPDVSKDSRLTIDTSGD